MSRFFFGCKVPGKPMEIDGRSRRFERIVRHLREQAYDHSGEHIARSSGSKANIAGRIDKGSAVRANGLDRFAFYDDDRTACPGDLAAILQTVTIGFLPRFIDEQ